MWIKIRSENAVANYNTFVDKVYSNEYGNGGNMYNDIINRPKYIFWEVLYLKIDYLNSEFSLNKNYAVYLDKCGPT